MFTRVFICFGLLSLTACATGIDPGKYNDDPASRQKFTQCHGYSCTVKSPTGLDDSEWRGIEKIFTPVPKDAVSERIRIGEAVAALEKITGQKTGTDADLAMAGTLKENDRQLDCIDETINTTHYLRFLETGGLLKYHEPAPPTHRGYFIDGRWPHNTAVIREKATGALFVVDSFYKANGETPYILPRSQWLAGWKPPGANQ